MFLLNLDLFEKYIKKKQFNNKTEGYYFLTVFFIIFVIDCFYKVFQNHSIFSRTLKHFSVFCFLYLSKLSLLVQFFIRQFLGLNSLHHLTSLLQYRMHFERSSLCFTTLQQYFIWLIATSNLHNLLLFLHFTLHLQLLV